MHERLLGILAISLFALFINTEILARKLPIKSFAKQADLFSVSLSPNGSHIAFISRVDSKERSGNAISVLNLETKEQNNFSFTDNSKFSYRAISWLNDQTLLLRLEHPRKRGKTLSFDTRLYKMDIETGTSETLVPDSLFGHYDNWVPSYYGYIVDYIDSDPDHVLFATTVQQSKGDSVFLVNLKGEKPVLVQKGINYYHSWMADQKSHLRLAKSSNVRDRNRIVLRDPEKSVFKTLWEFDADSNDVIIPMGFDQDPNILYFKTMFENRWVIFKTDVSEKELSRTLVYDNPDDEILGELFYSRSTKRVVGVYKGQGDGYLFWDQDYQKLDRSLNRALPELDNYFYGFSKGEKRLLVFSSSEVDSGSYYVWDREDKKLDLVAYRDQELDPAVMTKPLHDHYTARDGKERPAIYTFPNNTGQAQPTIIYLVHEPGYLFYKSFVKRVQFFANEGYNVVQIPIRDPMDYSEKRRETGVLAWGPDTVNDVIDLAKILSKNDLVDAENICVFGERYGGTISLLAASSDEFKFRCAISVGGVTDFRKHIKFKRKYDSYWRHKRYVGSEMQKSMKFAPITNAQKMDIPLLLAHGSEDKMVEASQSQLLKDKLEELNYPVKHTVIDGATHTMNKEGERLKLYTKLAVFLAENTR